MRSILVPNPITIRLPILDGTTGEPKSRTVTFAEFVNENLLSDKKFTRGGTIKDLRRAMRVLKQFEGACEVQLEETDWEDLKTVCEHPTNGWQSYYAMQLLPFIDAIMDAKEVEAK